MAETKAQIEEERDRLRAENERLRGQLATAGAVPRVAQAAQSAPWLSEGERQELETYGRATSPFTGQEVTAAQAREAHPGVDIAEAKPGAVKAAGPLPRRVAAPREGVDYVYPSVAPGVLAQEFGGPAETPVPVDTGADVDPDADPDPDPQV